MTLRNKILIYLVLVHVVMGGFSVYWLRGHGAWLIVAEACFALSLAVGFLLVRRFFVPLELIRTGAELIRERDFSTRFRDVGQPEMDLLIEIYNRMTDQLREERLKLEEQHLLMDKILRSSPAGIVTLDFDGRITMLNPSAAKLFQLPAEEALGKHLTELQQLGQVDPGRSTVLPLAGGRRVRCSRVGFMDRGFERSFVLFEEMTEELRASERAAYGKLIRMMSHEVNNSVGAVGSLLESFKTYRDQLNEGDREDYEHALGVAVGRLESLRGFMNGFADVVRLPTPALRTCDLPGLVRDLLLLLRPELEHRRIRTEVHVEDGFPSIRADKNQMEQALVNVIKNAYESIDSDGTITLRMELDEGRPILLVRDTGGGVSEEVRANLFTPFYSTKRDGRGIGLTLIQEILTGHGFDFRLTGSEEAGAEFRIDF